jgi:glyoxylase-like metal-dependent hydrolase (beta-lactamase superfamily II)
MNDLLTLAERVFDGAERLPQTGLTLAVDMGLREMEDGVAFVPSFCNVMPVKTEEGLALIDTGAALVAPYNFAAVRAWSDAPLHTAVYTHGHIDHCMGMDPWDDEARALGRTPPRVVAHRAVLARFERYVATAGYNGAINRRQFQLDSFEWPTQYRAPDVLFDDALSLSVGGRRFAFTHARGETDDHAWIVLDGRVLYPGDLFLWCSPNAGNPQKVQRYPLDWARALRAMAAQKPALMLPSHGLPLAGEARIERALLTTAEALEHLHDHTLRMMNEGASLDAILGEVQLPRALAELPWLQPIYDEPEFIVHNVWRLYGGWWDGDPAHLHPPRERALAEEMASLSGGAIALANRAMELIERDERDGPRLALQLARWAKLAAPTDARVAEVWQRVTLARVASASSTMARGIYAAAAREEPAR